MRQPQNFSLDWRRFYELRTQRTVELRRSTRVSLHEEYGADPKQRLDLYLPVNAKHAPVLLFLHGGGFVEGDRAHYGYLAEPYVAAGVICAIASYRLSDAGAPYPAPRDDVRRAVAWLHRQVARYGGDPTRLVVSGHSAGAILAADVAVDRSWMRAYGIPARAVRGAVLVSGRYRLGPGERAFSSYVPTPELERRASPLYWLVDPVAKFVIAAGETEAAYLQPSRTFAAALRARRVETTFLVLPGLNHQQTVDALGDPASPLFRATLDLLGRDHSGAR